MVEIAFNTALSDESEHRAHIGQAAAEARCI